jgi:hypothetical protein
VCVSIAGTGEQCGTADGHFGNSTDEKAENYDVTRNLIPDVLQ